MKNLIVVKAGENVFLDAEVFGKPLPKVSWKRDGVPLVLAEGMKMVQKKHVHLLELYSVTRKETGDYTILAENINGSKYATIKVKVLGKFHFCLFSDFKCYHADIKDGAHPFSHLSDLTSLSMKSKLNPSY